MHNCNIFTLITLDLVEKKFNSYFPFDILIKTAKKDKNKDKRPKISIGYIRVKIGLTRTGNN